jgi:hypothetical protein
MLAVIIYAFMARELEKPLVIEEAARPRCKKTCMKKRPVGGKSNKKARTTCGGMTESI